MISNKYVRKRNPNEDTELTSLFQDPRFTRQAFQSVGAYLLSRPACRPITQLDENGEETADSRLESYTFDSLKRDLHTIAEATGEEEREPTELEMLLACQIRQARHSTQAAVFVRDSVGAAPIKQTQADITIDDDYSKLTDEEVDLLLEYRAKKSNEENESCAYSDTQAEEAVDGTDTTHT